MDIHYMHINQNTRACVLVAPLHLSLFSLPMSLYKLEARTRDHGPVLTLFVFTALYGGLGKC